MSAGFFAELRRRNVFRMAGLYLAAAWVAVEIAGTVLPMLGAPDWVGRALLALLAIGVVPALIFAWVFEVTPEGLKREGEVEPQVSITPQTGKRMDRAIIAILLLGLLYMGFDKFVLAPKREVAIAATATATATKAQRTAASAIPDKSIAVLPLANESGDQDQLYFSDGLSENLINALMQFEGLKVIGRNSAFQFRDSKDDAVTIGRKLGVAHLLEGSVRRVGNMVRINAQLIRAADGSGLWSQSFDRPYTDLFALQDEITKAVADALKTKLLATTGAAAQGDRPPGGNLEAYNAYLQGNFYLGRNTDADYRKAIDAFTTATRLDPRYALAWARLSRSWASLSVQGLSGAAAQQAYVQARTAADQALSLAPDLAEAHVARGFLLLVADFDWTGAEAAFRRAVALAPNDGTALYNLGNLQATLGQPEAAVALTRQALAIDPLRANGHLWQANYLSGLGRLDEAEQSNRRAIELQPAAANFHAQLAVIAIQRGDAGAALAAARQEPAGVWQDIALAQAQQISGDAPAADAALKTLIDKQGEFVAYQIAQIYALRREPDKVFEWLDTAWKLRDPGIGYLLFDPFILRYRVDPRFAAYAKKVGLPTTTDAKALP